MYERPVKPHAIDATSSKPNSLVDFHTGGLKAYARLKAQDTSFMGRMFTLRDLREAD